MTGPVITIDAQDSTPLPLPRLRRARWRTVLPDEILTARWAPSEADRCTNINDNDRRCMLCEHHDGVHAWRALGGLRVFEWD